MGKLEVLKREFKPLINIITRTNSRPNGFHRCATSIKNQTYKNIRHIVAVDQEKDLNYVSKYDCDVFVLDKDLFEKQKDIPDPKTGGKFVYNLYFNYLISQVNEGWIIILDDDDYFNDNNAVSDIVKTIQFQTDMILWQMQYPNGIKLPSDLEINKKPNLARIGAPCVAVHSSIAKQIKWDGWKCGDFRYINKAWQMTYLKRWVRRPLIQLGTNVGGLGRRLDVSSTPAPTLKVTSPDKNDFSLAATVTRQNIVSQDASKLPYYDIVIGISSYNRFYKLMELLNTIKEQPTKYSYRIVIMDDCSTERQYVDTFLNQKEYDYIRNSKNLKKIEYWRTINNLLNKVSQYNFKYFIQLDDDFGLCKSFIDTVVNEFIQTPESTLALNFSKLTALELEGGKRWGFVNYVDGGAAYKRRALEELKFAIDPISKARFKVNAKISSGVWQQVTTRLNKIGKDSISILPYSLITHDYFDKSQMNAFRNKNDNLMNKIKTTDFLEVEVPIVMCTWKRFERLKITLDLLEQQETKNFSFNIWNNNIDIVKKIDDLIKNTVYSFPIHVKHSKENKGGFGRFYYAKELAEQGYDKVIFIDDDETFGPSFVTEFLKDYEPKTIKSRWSWRLKSKYWHRERVLPGSDLQPQYCGTNGMIADISVFKDDDLFKCPEEYWFIEDLWLCYYARIVKGYTLKPSSINMEVIVDKKDQFHGLVTKKDDFYLWLEKNFTKDNYQNYFNNEKSFTN